MKRSLLILAALAASASAADPRGDTPGTQPSTPQEELAKFHLPPGFEIQLVAAEPEIQKPINFNFDAAGRLWVTGSELYPWPASTDPNGQPIPDFDKGWKGLVDGFRVGDAAPPPSPVGRDTVRILSDFGPDGHARKITVFADKLNIPSGIQPLPRKPNTKGDTAIVYSIPNIWLLTDADGDGFAEKREPLYTGFGYTDTHGGSSSYIYWIDGWIYGTHGFRNHSEVRDRNGKVTVVDSGNTYRFRPDGTAFEIYAHGQTNPFGLAFDPLGNLFSADSHSKPVYMLLRGGYYEGIGKQHDGLGFAPRITDDDHGSSAIGGIIYYADDKWPAEYRGNLFNGNPVTQRINRDRLEWHGSTPRAIRMPDFLTSDDPWFRPVFLKLGPDGALYIADFYNPIIGHYEVPLTHPARDHTHGRIWRVVYRGENAGASSGGHDESGSTRAPRVVSGAPPETSTTPGAAALPSPEGGAARAGDASSARAPKTAREARALPISEAGFAPLDATREPGRDQGSVPAGVPNRQSGAIVPQQRGTPSSSVSVTFPDTDKVLSASGKVLSMPDKVLSAPEKVLPAADKTFAVIEKVLPATEKVLPVPEKVLSATDKVLPVAEKVLPVTGKVLPVTGKVLSATDKEPSNADKGTSAADKAVPAGDKAAPEPPRAASTTAKTPSSADKAPPGAPETPAGAHASPAGASTTPAGAPEVPTAPDLTKLDALGLVKQFANPSLEVRRLATNELVDRGGKQSLDPLVGYYRNDIPTPSVTHAELALWAFERLGAGENLEGYATDKDDVVAIQALKILSEREKLSSEQSRIVRLFNRLPRKLLARAGNEVLSRHPSSESIGFILKGLEFAPPDDFELIYGLRMALRDNLLVTDGFNLAAQIEAKFPEQGERLADVSLAIKTPDSAAFLLAHLERTKLETPRAGEYLKHGVLYLPAEKLDAVVKLVGQVGEAPLPRRLALATNLAEAARQRGGALPKDITAWSQGVILAALESGSDDLSKPAIAAVRDEELEAKLAPLAKIVRDETRGGALRLAALEAAANLPASRELLTATFADERHMSLRKRAAEILAVSGDFGTVLPAIAQSPWELAVAIASGLARTDPGATALLDAIEAGKAPARLLTNRAVAGPFIFSRPKALQDRAKALAKDLPPEDARLDQVIAERADAFRKAKPDAAHGAQIFQQQCVVCHRFRNAGGNVGPNLDGVIARGPQRLIEDILDPSRNVDPGFRQTIVETANGQTLAGTNVRAQGDAVLLTDATGKEISVPKTTIKTQTQTQLSLMPPVFETTIPPGDFNDLLAYLLSAAK